MSSLQEAFKDVVQQDEDDDNDIDLLLILAKNNARLPKWRNKRLSWSEHLARERHCGTFANKYHMDEETFNKLVNNLKPLIWIDPIKSMASTSGNVPIYPELVVATGLRFLGGELTKSLEDIMGIDHASVDRIIELFLDAVESSPMFDIKLPSTNQEKEIIARGFSAISESQGTFNGTIGAIDGWLCCTCQPIDRDIRNKRDYFSGHYQKFGLNIQAVCDANQRFLYFAVAAPGKTNDARAVQRCLQLQQWLLSLQDSPYYIVGDNAYVLCDELQIPFSGTNVSNEKNRTYNFYLSQLRIRIEMAFGLLTSKWRIFRKDLTYSLRKNSQICQVAARLHNFVINERLAKERDESADEIDAMPNAPNGLGYLPSDPLGEQTNGNTATTHENSVPLGFSARRTVLVEHLSEYGIARAGTKHSSEWMKSWSNIRDSIRRVRCQLMNYYVYDTIY